MEKVQFEKSTTLQHEESSHKKKLHMNATQNEWKKWNTKKT